MQGHVVYVDAELEKMGLPGVVLMYDTLLARIIHEGS